MRSTQKKNHQNPSTNKKSAGGSKSPPLGEPPNLKDVSIPRVKNVFSTSWMDQEILPVKKSHISYNSIL